MTRECIRIDSVRGGGARVVVCVWRTPAHAARRGVDARAHWRRWWTAGRDKGDADPYRAIARSRGRFARAAVIVCVRAVVCVCVCGVVCVVCGGGDVVVVVVVVVVCVLTRLFAYVCLYNRSRPR